MSTSVARTNDLMRTLQEALGARYALLGELGRGGMGVVYLAHDPVLDRQVALKVMPPRTASVFPRTRFMDEARIAARMSHPSIVQILTVDQAKDFVYFTMPFVAGETLGNRIRARGALPVREVLTIMHQVAGAVAYAHERGVVHRDLKPDNILLEAGTDRPIVLDFGVAFRGEDPDAGKGFLRGTLAYVSPERARGHTADPRADIYALGVTAFCAAAGRPPVTPTSANEILEAHARHAVTPLAARGQDGDATLAKVVARCMAEEPNDRYQSADELVEALARAPEIRGETPVSLRTFVTRSHRLAQSGAGLSVLLVGALAALAGGETAWGAGALALLVGTPLATVLPAIRRVLDAGYGRGAMVRALETDLERRRADLTFELGDLAARGRVARRVAYAALGVMALSAGWLGTGFHGANAAFVALFLSVPVATIAGLVSMIRARAPRQTLAASWWLRLLRSPVGRWVTRFAGLGRQLLEAATVERSPLFEAPAVLRLMDSQIERIQAWLDGPDSLDGEIELTSGWLTGHQAGLESLRGRIATGSNGGPTPGPLTADLAAARRVCEMVELALGGRLAADDMRAAE